MIIREASMEELDSLNAFYFEMNRVINTRTDKYNPDNPVYPAPEMVADAIRNRAQYVGMEDGVIACACIVNRDCPAGYHRVKWQADLTEKEFRVLHALRVSPDYEGRGFSRQMMEYTFARAKEAGVKAIRLDVLEGYSVENMYLRMGFQYVDTIEIFYEDIGMPQRFRLLEKLLTEVSENQLTFT